MQEELQRALGDLTEYFHIRAELFKLTALEKGSKLVAEPVAE